MAFTKVCKLDDLWEGEMEAFEIDGHEILLVSPEGGEIRAFQGVCPHQDIPLVEGKFDGKVIVCRAHQWIFDGASGKGINPWRLPTRGIPRQDRRGRHLCEHGRCRSPVRSRVSAHTVSLAAIRRKRSEHNFRSLHQQ